MSSSNFKFLAGDPVESLSWLGIVSMRDGEFYWDRGIISTSSRFRFSSRNLSLMRK